MSGLSRDIIHPGSSDPFDEDLEHSLRDDSVIGSAGKLECTFWHQLQLYIVFSISIYNLETLNNMPKRLIKRKGGGGVDFGKVFSLVSSKTA